MFRVVLVASLAIVGVAGAARDALLLVVCSPGSPGTTDEAQPRMDAFATALSAKAGTEIDAVYEPTEAGGVSRIANASLAIVSLPFFLEHERDLDLHPRLVAVQEGRPTLESWVLVAGKGKIVRADQLAKFSIVSSAAFAPGFVRGAVEAGLGTIPSTVKVVQSRAVLSSLRRAASGEDIAVLLDGTQAAALASLPFASKLAVVTRTPAWPAGLVVTVASRVSAKRWSSIERALRGLGSERVGAAALTGIQIARFAPLDERVLAGARRAFASSHETRDSRQRAAR